MPSLRRIASVAAALLAVSTMVVMTSPTTAEQPKKPIVIGHRGASGYRPEHTLASYQLAIDMGADFVEPDLVSTKDGVLVARHENEIGGTTDVSTHAEFAGRQTTKVIDGVSITGWFTEDFTLAELKTLRARERLPAVRPQNAAYDGQFPIPTFQEVIDLVKQAEHTTGRRIGIYPETKHPTYFDSIGLSLEEKLVDTLDRNGYQGRDARVFIQSFEVSNLKQLSRMTRVPLIQLIDAAGKPYDFVVKNDPRTYADMVTPQGLAEIRNYAAGVGANKALIFPRDGSQNLLPSTKLIENAHRVGLIVHAWTFRRENQFLPANYRVGSDPNAVGNLAGEIKQFLSIGLDGFFTDNPDIGVKARDERQSSDAVLVARAVLPADTFAAGPPSGAFIGAGPFNGRTPPFASQPVQGISALIDAPGNAYYALADNGYGAKANSSDFLLRAYRVRPNWETRAGGPGTVDVLDFVSFRDPDHKVPWPIVNSGTSDRLLTGADFDIESIRIDYRGDFWVGDEFGPFLLHFATSGKLLEAPIPLAGVKSPDSPTPGGGAATLPSSRGFEGMAITPNGKTLIPTLEGALIADPDQRRRIFYEFDIPSRSYTGRTWNYHMEDAANSFGDVTALDANRLLVIERDGGQGTGALLKRIYRVDLRRTDAQGFLVKTLILDLMFIPDPDGISLPALPGAIGLGNPFSFPFVTIESVLPLPGGRLLIANDNNYPFSSGRMPGQPDGNEMIIVKVDALTEGD